jgi:Na+/H+ antiporter NhaA
MENFYINHIAVLVCAVMSLVIGAVWWSPLLFAKTWQKENGLSDEQVAGSNPLKTFGLTFLLAWIMSYNLAFCLAAPGTTWQWGVAAGLLAGVGWVVAMFIVIALFEQRSWKYMAINCGYITVYFAVIGFILGVWR